MAGNVYSGARMSKPMVDMAAFAAFLKDKIPADCENMVVIWTPANGEHRMCFAGTSEEELVILLYSLADETCRQKIPLPESKLKH